MPRPRPAPPAAYLVDGAWPSGQLAPNAPSHVRYAVVIAARLADAVAGLGVREAARRADLDHATLSRLLRGESIPDLATLAALEVGLGVRLWPSSQELRRALPEPGDRQLEGRDGAEAGRGGAARAGPYRHS